jgi:L-alanine-DL-glutamate epimerase-like enolase superfamily enzyme
VYGSQPAKCAIDLAIYDLLGKSLNLPAYALIGGKRRDSFFTTWTLPAGRDGVWSMDELKTEARLRYDQGYRAFEMHTITTDETGFGDDMLRVAGVREVCPGVALDVDAHRNWGIKTSIAASKVLAQYGAWLEQPVVTLREMAEVRAGSEVGLIADNSCESVESLVEIIQLKAADAICLKPIKAGGLFKSMQMVHMAERFGMPVRVDGIPGESKLSNTATAHVAMTLKQPIVCGVMQHARNAVDIVTSGGIDLRDGQVYLPDVPGLGCEVSDEHLRLVEAFR